MSESHLMVLTLSLGLLRKPIGADLANLVVCLIFFFNIIARISKADQDCVVLK